jgi:hypothetical protein
MLLKKFYKFCQEQNIEFVKNAEESKVGKITFAWAGHQGRRHDI